MKKTHTGDNYFIHFSSPKKLLIIMKLIVLLSFVLTFNLSASVYSQNARFSLDIEQHSIREVLKIIEDQSQFRFFYNDDFTDMDNLVSLSVKDNTVYELLSKVLENTDVTYKVLDNNFVVITPASYLQQKKITGSVTDASTNEPLPGVYVTVDSTRAGVITDINGNYSIEASSENTLTFSSIGFMTQKVKVGNSSVVNIAMNPDIKNLEEVVVIGYGVQKKSLVTGAISSVKSEDIGKTNISRPEEALQGRTSGVQVVPQSGSPGAGMNVRIRGYSSNSNSNPIYIVDGTKTGDINFLDPSDIASIEVLKDAASSAIYGAEGGNGVVMITTKKGQSGAMHIIYDFQHSFKSVGKLPELMNTKQYTQFMTDTNSTGASVLPAGTLDQTVNTDWLGTIFENGASTKHHVTFSGGNEKSNFLVAISYFKNDGIIVGNKDVFERYSIRFNSDHQLTKWIKVGNNLDYARFTTKGINENGGEFGGMIGSALQLDPTTPVEFTKGTPAWITDELNAYNTDHKTDLALVKAPNGNDYGVSPNVAGEITNPLISRDLQTGVYTQDKLMGNVYAEITPFKGLTITSRMGLDFAVATNHFWNKTFYYDATNLNSTPIATEQWNHYYTWLWENFASYTKKLGDHSLTLLAGMSSEKFVHKNLNGRSVMMADHPDFSYVEFSEHKADNVTGYPHETRKVSYFARGSYDYKGKYLLQASIRRDGAALSQVPKNGRWGIFPSVSAGWILSEESFFPKTVLSHVKIRGSWGQNGSLAALDEANQYGYSTTITGTIGGQPISYPLSDGTLVLGAEPTRLYNGGLTWETAEQIDLGVDLRAFSDRLTFTVDYYKKTTKDLIFTGIPSYTSGNYAPRFNGGTVENKGLEFDLGYRNVIGELKYAVNVNLSTLKNKVTALDPLLGTRQNGANIGTGWNNATLFEPGHSIYHFFGYKTNGIDPETGEPIFVTEFGNDTSYLYIQDKDKQDIGSAIPKLLFGANINLEYKGFDFTLTLSGQQGNKVLVGWLRSDKNRSNRPTVFSDDRWRKTGDNASMPGANWSANTFYSDLLVFDGSFLRIQTIQLGYSIPSSLLKQAKVNSLRVYVSLNNFFTFTKYPGLDPQPTIQNNASNNIGIDRGTYPMAKDVMIGASISF
jgi:TonB-linked SusC/RagA family outer membrane protein